MATIQIGTAKTSHRTLKRSIEPSWSSSVRDDVTGRHDAVVSLIVGANIDPAVFHRITCTPKEARKFAALFIRAAEAVEEGERAGEVFKASLAKDREEATIAEVIKVELEAARREAATDPTSDPAEIARYMNEGDPDLIADTRPWRPIRCRARAWAYAELAAGMVTL